MALNIQGLSENGLYEKIESYEKFNVPQDASTLRFIVAIVKTSEGETPVFTTVRYRQANVRGLLLAMDYEDYSRMKESILSGQMDFRFEEVLDLRPINFSNEVVLYVPATVEALKQANETK